MKTEPRPVFRRSLADRLALALCLAVNTEERRDASLPTMPTAPNARFHRGLPHPNRQRS